MVIKLKKINLIRFSFNLLNWAELGRGKGVCEKAKSESD